ncbi:MAG: hypothetical protein EXR62_06755 [Chloroflexi bacterium]|nr:hypothetical protein [Chloroflexota bacterium]
MSSPLRSWKAYLGTLAIIGALLGVVQFRAANSRAPLASADAACVAADWAGAGPESRLSPEEGQIARDIALKTPLPAGAQGKGFDPHGADANGAMTLATWIQGKQVVLTKTFPTGYIKGESDSYPCASGRCAQVEFYDVTDKSTLVSIVDLDRQQLLEVFAQPGAAPVIGPDLAERVCQAVTQDPKVKAATGSRQYYLLKKPWSVSEDQGPCATGWCTMVALSPDPTRFSEDGLLVLVDMQTNQVVDFYWRRDLRNAW